MYSYYKSNPTMLEWKIVPFTEESVALAKRILLKPRKGEAEIPSANFRARLRSDHPKAVEVATKLYKMGVLPEQIEWI